MSFTPLPKIFTEICSRQDSPSAQVLELGCGDGRFGEMMVPLGLRAWGLDRLGPAGGTVADCVGDALAPPVASGALDLLLAPNVLRHLLPAAGDFSFLGRWLALLKPGGSLFIFEDEPSVEPKGAAHYRDLQVFLRQLMPQTRGPLLSLEEFKRRSAAFRRPAAWEFGLVRNRYPLDAAAVVQMLGQGGAPGGEAGRLIKAIGRDGLDPGFYWWSRATVPTTGDAS